MADMKIVPVYRGNEMVLPITGVNAVMDGEGNNLPMIFAKKDATTSDAWNPDITYTTGQYCLDNNTLWRCLIQNENTKPTEGTYWTRETIGNNLVTTDGEGNRGYLKADGSFSPFSNIPKESGTDVTDTILVSRPVWRDSGNVNNPNINHTYTITGRGIINVEMFSCMQQYDFYINNEVKLTADIHSLDVTRKGTFVVNDGDVIRFAGKGGSGSRYTEFVIFVQL